VEKDPAPSSSYDLRQGPRFFLQRNVLSIISIHRPVFAWMMPEGAGKFKGVVAHAETA